MEVAAGDRAEQGLVEGDRSLAHSGGSAALVEAGCRYESSGLDALEVALGSILAAVALVRRALDNRVAGARDPRRPPPLAALIPGALGGAGIGAVRLGVRVTSRVGAPLRRPLTSLTPLLRPVESPLRAILSRLDGTWDETRAAAEASSAVFARSLERELVRAVLAPLDLTEIVRTHIDVEALAREIDVQQIVARIDLDALVAGLDLDAIVSRLDLDALAQEVLDEIDLPALIRESTGTLTADAIEEVRFVSLGADRVVARVVDRVMRRSRRMLEAPGDPSSLTQQPGGGGSAVR